MTSDTEKIESIKYKNMFLSNNNTSHINSDIAGIDKFLESECKASKTEPWSKLNKTIKIGKINNYIETLVGENNLSSEEVLELKEYILNCLDKKKLQCVKDVIYDKTTGSIKNIPCLIFNKTSRKFTLKRSEKRVSTLKSLGPGKTRKNAKEKSNSIAKEKSNKQDTNIKS